MAGNTMGWFQGWVYAPSGTILDEHDLTIIFAAYHTPKPKYGRGDYRTIGKLSFHSSRLLRILDDQEWTISEQTHSQRVMRHGTAPEGTLPIVSSAKLSRRRGWW